MKLGILVNTDKHLRHIIGICNAAMARGIAVSIFVMDDGVYLTKNQEFLDLLKKGIEISMCDQVYHEKGLNGKVEGVLHGTQYENATIAHDCDRFLVF